MSRSESSERPRRRPIAPALAFLVVPLLTFGLAVVGTSLLTHRPSLTYYQTIGFLIPSLLVTLALQGEFFRTAHVVPAPTDFAQRHPRLARSWLHMQRASDVLLLSYLAAGEFAALYVLATEDVGVVPFALTGGSVTTAFVALGILALHGMPWLEAPGPETESPDR